MNVSEINKGGVRFEDCFFKVWLKNKLGALSGLEEDHVGLSVKVNGESVVKMQNKSTKRFKAGLLPNQICIFIKM